MKDKWEKEPYKVECQVAEGIPSYQNARSWARWTTTTLEEKSPEESETEEAPQIVNCPSLALY